MAGLEIVNREKPGRMKGYAAKEAAALYGMLVLVFAAYFSVFETNSYVVDTFLLPVPASMTAVLVCRRGGRKGVLPVLLSVLGAVVLMLTPWNLWKGISYFVNGYIELNNMFYHIRQPLLDASQSPADILPSLLGVQLLLAVMIESGTLAKHRSWSKISVILAGILPFAVAATVGKMPSLLTSWFLLGGVLLYLQYRQSGKTSWHSGAGILISLSLLFGVSQAAMPFIREYREEHEERFAEIYDSLVEMQQIDMKKILEERLEGLGEYRGGGVGKGNLQNLSEFVPSGEKQLEVIVSEKPSGTLYLRSYTGVSYTGKEWKRLTTSQFRNGMPEVSGETGRRALLNEPFTRISEGTAGLKVRKISIRREGASSEFSYIPYFAEITQKEKIYLDAWVKGKRVGEEEYRFYNYEDAEDTISGDLAGESELWKAYLEFVKESYCTFPEGLETLKSLSSSMGSGNAEWAERELNSIFIERLGLRYSKTPGELPEGKEFTEYFLTENRKGFCVHFATAATLFYRAAGYPSRFVEGYAIPASAFSRRNDGVYRAVVTDEMAHAWCETFDDEIGWVVREHTPPYMDEMDVENGDDEWADGRTEQSGTEEDFEDRNQAREENPDSETGADDGAAGRDEAGEQTVIGESGETGQAGDDGNGANTFLFFLKKAAVSIASIAGAVFLVFLLLVIFRNLGRQKRYAGFRKRKENQGIANLYQAVYEICLFDGMEPNPENERITLERMKMHFTQLKDEEWEWMYLCAERAAFSGEEITREEQKKMFRLYQKFRKEYLKTLNRKKKFWFLYGKGL